MSTCSDAAPRSGTLGGRNATRCRIYPRRLYEGSISADSISLGRTFGAPISGERCAAIRILSGAHLERANLFKAVLEGADLAGAFLFGAQFLNCAQLIVAREWQSAFRDDALGCGAPVPERSS